MRLLQVIPLTLGLAGCQTSSKPVESMAESHRLIDATRLLGHEIHASPEDFVREGFSWITDDPKKDRVLLNAIGFKLETIFKQQSCDVNTASEGAFKCQVDWLLKLSEIKPQANIVLELEREGRLKQRVKKFAFASSHRDQLAQTLHVAGGNPRHVTEARQGDIILFKTQWQRSKYGMTQSEDSHYGVSVRKLWDQSACQGGSCKYSAYFEVLGSEEKGAIAVHLMNQGNSVRTWQQRLVIY